MVEVHLRSLSPIFTNPCIINQCRHIQMVFYHHKLACTPLEDEAYSSTKQQQLRSMHHIIFHADIMITIFEND